MQGQTLETITGTITQDDDLWVIESELVGRDYVAVVKLPGPNINSYMTFVEAVVPAESLRGLLFRNALPAHLDPDFHTGIGRLIQGLHTLFAIPV